MKQRDDNKIQQIFGAILKGQQIGQGAAFTGMLRQLGGSFGIAMVTTYMARQNMIHRSALVSKLDVNNPAVMNRVHGIALGFQTKGIAANTALQSSYQWLDYAIGKQAAVLSYMDVFLYIGIMFLICIPFVLLVKGGRANKIDLSEAMH